MNKKSDQNTTLGERIYGYLSNNGFMIPMLASMFISYIYFISHQAIAVDTLSGVRYNLNGMVAQKRFTANYISKILTYFGNKSFMFNNVFGILLLAFAAILFCVLLDRFVPKRSITSRTIFACIFVTAPIYVESIPYQLGLQIGGGMTLVALALYLVVSAPKGWKGVLYNFVASFICMQFSAWYEALCVAYVIGAIALVITKIIFSEERVSFKEIFIWGIRFLIPLAIGTLFKKSFLIYATVKKNLGKGSTASAQNTINIIKDEPHNISKLLHAVRHNYLYSGIWFTPITIYVFSKCLCMILMVYYTIRKRNLWLIPLFLLLHLSNMLLVILSWEENLHYLPMYRTCIFFGLYTAIVFFMFIEAFKPKASLLSLRKVAVAVSVYLIIIQVIQCDYWLSLNVRRYDEESQVLTNAAQILTREYDMSKPVAFVGEYKLSDYYMDKAFLTKGSTEYKRAEKIAQLTGESIIRDSIQDGRHFGIRSATMSQSVINWSLTAFGEPNSVLISYFNFEGFKIQRATREMIAEANEMADSMPDFPAQGSIVDVGDYIVLKF